MDAGIITLKGNVHWYWQRDKAKSLVSGLRGAIDVINELAVVPTENFSDEFIAEHVVKALEHSAVLEAGKVVVKVDKGVVTFTGEVRIPFARWHAERIAKNIRGVMSVHNELTIKYF